MTTLPRISILVPNYNGGATLERCLRSVLDQQYPDLELLVADGGSTDGSRAILQRYADRLTWWCSEPDRGQSHAINKAYARATGSVVNWLCSDDELLPGALAAVGRWWAEHPDDDVLCGPCRVEFDDQPQRSFTRRPRLHRLATMPASNPTIQQSTFIRRAAVGRRRLVVECYVQAMDTELINHLRSRNRRFARLPGDAPLAVFHITGANKTATGGPRIIRELTRIYLRYARLWWKPLVLWHRWYRHPLQRNLLLWPRSPQRHAARRKLRELERRLGRWYGLRHVKALNWRWIVQLERHATDQPTP